MKLLLKTHLVACIVFMHIATFAHSESDNSNKVELNGTNLKKESVNMYVTAESDLLVSYANPAGMPRLFQFSANSNAEVPLTVQIVVSDNKEVQTITREINLTENGAFYEMPIHPYLAANMSDNPDAVVKSVRFINNSNSKVMVRETLFSSTSINYPIGINQVFVMDMMSNSKRYFVHSSFPRPVNLNIYDAKGELMKREKIILEPGDNFITLDMMQDLRPGKYVMLVTDITKTNIANTMTVMF